MKFSEERKEELEQTIAGMKAASSCFYSLATRLNNHTFIEFTGFINEYIKICENALTQGIDFTQASTHSGMGLPMKTHEAMYIAEKFDCIFGPSFRAQPECWETFAKAMQ